MNLQASLFAFLALGLSACHGGSAADPAATVATVLSGHLDEHFADEPQTIRVFDWSDGKPGVELCSVASDAQRAWSCALGPISGAFLVRAENPRTRGLRAIVDGVETGEARVVPIGPVTELVAAKVDALERSGQPASEALPRARRLLYAHFGAIDAGAIVPTALDRGVTSLDDATLSAILSAGFVVLAATLAMESGLSPDGIVNRWTVVDALAADIGADGVFDGRGLTGALRQGTVALDGDTLRATYGQAILGWLDGPANPTAISARAFGATAEAMASDTSEIFPSGAPAPLVPEAPVITRFALRSGTRTLEETDPAAGNLVLEVSAISSTGTIAMDLQIDDGRPGVSTVLERHPGYTSWQIDGSLLADGPHLLTLLLTSPKGSASRSRRFIVDSTSPTLTATAAGRFAVPQVWVSGTVADAIGPIDRVELTGSATVVVVRSPGPRWVAALPLRCDGVWPIEARAFDAAGNMATQTLTVRCDATPPRIGFDPSVFHQETSLDAVYAVDGTRVEYTWQAAVDTIVLDGTATSTLTKYFNRFDQDSDNLPSFAIWASDGEGGLTLDYQVLLNGVPESDWRSLDPIATNGPRAEYTLPISYQTVSDSLATGAPTDVHALRFRATDDAGNETIVSTSFFIALRSPPLWFGGCAISPALLTFSLIRQNLDTLFRQPSADLVDGELRYLLGLGAQSHAPRGALRLMFTAGAIVARVTELSEDRHDAALNAWTPWCPPTWWPCAAFGAFPSSTLIADTDNALCGLLCEHPETPAEEIEVVAPSGDAVNDAEMPLGQAAASILGTPLPVLPDGTLLLAPDVRASASVQWPAPAIHFGGAPFPWSVGFSVPAGYAARSVPARYRVPTFNRVGINWELDTTGVRPWGNSYRFVTRAYVSAFEIDIGAATLSAAHSSLTDVPIAVQIAPECAAPQVYETHL